MTEEIKTADLSAPVASVKTVSRPNLSDIGINESDTIGLTCSPTILKNIIEMIALPKSKESDFPKFVLNFEEDRIWWGNTKQGVFFLDFGFASANYFDSIWGIGSVALSSSKLLSYIEQLRSYPQITFWANLKTKIYGIQAGDVFNFTNFMDNASDVKNAYHPTATAPKMQKFAVTFDDNYIPTMKEKENALIYGMDIESSELKTILDVEDKFSAKQCPFTISKKGITVSFNELNNPKDGAGRKLLIAKPGSEKLPEDDSTIELIVGTLLEGPAKNLQGPITLRFASSAKAPCYILYKQKNERGGILISGYILSTKDKLAK